jgi:TRAP-type C4-dicarboxylate transport system permease small subunit
VRALLRKKIKALNHYAQYVSGFTLMLLMMLMVAEVIARRFFNDPIGGSYELVCVLLTFIVFFAAGYAHHYREHVVIDFIYELLPRSGRRFISFLSTIIYLGTVLLMCWMVFKYGLALIATGATTAILKIPHWPIVIAAGVGLIGYALSVIGDLIFLIDGGVLSNDID